MGSSVPKGNTSSPDTFAVSEQILLEREFIFQRNMFAAEPEEKKSAVSLADDLGKLCSEMVSLIDQHACSAPRLESDQMREREEFAGKVCRLNEKLEESALNNAKHLSPSAVSKILAIGETTHKLLMVLKEEGKSESNTAIAELRSNVNQFRFELAKEHFGKEDDTVGYSLSDEGGQLISLDSSASLPPLDHDRRGLSRMTIGDSAPEPDELIDLNDFSLQLEDPAGASGLSHSALDDSALTFGADDSGIGLMDFNDSGIDLDAGDSGIALDLFDDSEITFGEDDSGISLDAASDSGINLIGDDSGISLATPGESDADLSSIDEFEVAPDAVGDSELEIEILERSDSVQGVDNALPMQPKQRGWLSRLFS